MNEIEFINRQRKVKVTRELRDMLSLCAETALKSERVPFDTHIDVTFVSDRRIREINREFRDKDAVTDVLSFPQFDPYEYMQDWDEVSLGDVVICEERAHQQAEEFGHSYERELIYLFVHSCFHLLGYDHETEEEKRVMREKEEKIMTQLDLRRV